MGLFDRYIEYEAGTESSAPGTGETDGADSDSSAGTLNADTGQSSGTPPETIPYSRFKEVNDAYSELKDFKGLVDIGYDADSLRQLADFEAGFRENPTAAWLAIASQIEDLPQDLKDLVQRHLTGSAVAESTAKASEDGNGEDVPDWAQKLIKENEDLRSRETAREEREVAQANNELLDGIIKSWKEADKVDDLQSPDERKMLTFIVAHSRGARDVKDILTNARGEWLELREEMLGSALQPGTNAGSPRSVPSGGGSAIANTSGPPKTLAEASARAKARLEQRE
jgi:hypothetical protein